MNDSVDKFGELLDLIDLESNQTFGFSENVSNIFIEADILDVPIVTDFDYKIGNNRYKIDFYELESDKPELVIGSVNFQRNTEDILLKNDIDKYLGYLKNFVTNSLTSQLYKKLKQIDNDCREIADLSHKIYKNSDTIARIKLIFASNLVYQGKEIKSEKFLDKEIVYDIWDKKRFNRFLSSGIANPPIDVDFYSFDSQPSYIETENKNEIYETYLTFINGDVLEKIYDIYGTRLLDRNVRAFLQTRGKVNSDIQKTIKENPEYFLAYNNGLTITCDGITMTKDNAGNKYISTISDFQIVNGGQTTASLWHAKRKFKDINLKKIQIVAKINLLKDKSKLDQLASDISLFSNSQNKVNKADPKGNKEYYRTLEKLSRIITTPESVPENPGSKWFYERVRGAYAEEKNRKKSITEINAFIKEFPPQQRIEKSQSAKLENTWNLLPFYVSKGSQWNFLKHSELIDISKFKPNDDYFKRLVAKQIIWKKAEKIITDQKIPGYRANILTYTLSAIVNLTGNKIDLLAIWSKQGISEKFIECINRIAYEVRTVITSKQGNVTDYFKKEACWENVKEKITSLPIVFPEILKTGLNIPKHGEPIPINPEDENITFIQTIPSNVWKDLASWGKHTSLLENWQKSICMNIGKCLERKKPPSSKLAFHGKKIYEGAVAKGYKPE